MRCNASIFLIDDNPDDSEAIIRSLKLSGVDRAIEWFNGSEKALSALKERILNQQQLPCMIILDLNMPGIDGREMVRLIKKSSETAHIPIVILTTSADEKDVMECYKNGANSYMQKPVSFVKLKEAAKHFKDYWLISSILPR